MHAVVIGGTRFIGGHTVEDLLEHGYHVTVVSRGVHPNPFADEPKVTHVAGDRNDRTVLERALDVAVPDVVIDCIALVPQQVATAVDVFRGAGAYVFVSSSAAYARWDVPRREGETPLEPFGAEHAVDDPTDPESIDWSGYGARKAECDRVCFTAADDGTNAMVVRPTFVYGPRDNTERLDYWIDRVANHVQVLVPGDGDALVHHAYVRDVASALRTVAERGTPGEAYNVGARGLLTVDERLEGIANALETDVEIVHASERELAAHGLSVGDFPLIQRRPSVVDTAKLAALGWDSTPHDVALRETVDEHLESERTGRDRGPEREREARAIEALTG